MSSDDCDDIILLKQTEHRERQLATVNISVRKKNRLQIEYHDVKRSHSLGLKWLIVSLVFTASAEVPSTPACAIDKTDNR